MEQLVDFLKPDSDGKTLANETFKNKIFTDFTLRPPIGSQFTISGVKFEDCRVTPGTCAIRAGTILENVLFRNLKCGDAMHIAAEVVMRDVVIEGNGSPRMLWIRPSISAPTALPVPDGGRVCTLDITRYTGEVSVTGINVDCVRINPQLHIRISLEKMNAADWKSLGIGGLSYWRIIAGKISGDGAAEGIFSLPSKKDRNYEKSMAELDLLQRAAIL